MSVIQYVAMMVLVGLIGACVIAAGAWCGWKLGEWIDKRKDRR